MPAPARGRRKIPLDSCCGCLSLKTGSLIAGIGTMILSILTIIFMLVTNEKTNPILLIELPETFAKIVTVFCLCMTIFISLMLTIAVYKEKKMYMVPWVLLGIMLVICLLISILYTAVTELFFQNRVFNGVIILVGGLIITCFYFYMWLVTYSFYQKLREQDERLPYYKPQYSR